MSTDFDKIDILEAEKHLKIDENVKEAFDAWFSNIFLSDGNISEIIENIIRNESLKNPQIFYTVLLTAFDFDVRILSRFKNEMTDEISTQLWQEISSRDDLDEIASDFLNSINQTPICKNFTNMIVKPFVDQKGKSHTHIADIKELLCEEMPKFPEKHRHFKKCKADNEHLLNVIKKSQKRNKSQENLDITPNRTFKL